MNNQPQQLLHAFYKQRNWQPFAFQTEMLEKYLSGYSGLLNAPTGSGKTLAVWLPILIEQKLPKASVLKSKNLKVLWITPIRALVNDVRAAMESACESMEIEWQIATRTGDTPSSERQKQKKNIPDCLITTPESIHLMLAQKGYLDFFRHLQVVVIDEWHELMGSKRGVMTELALTVLKDIKKDLKVWGISATIGNLEQAMEVLLGHPLPPKSTIVRSDIDKKVEIISLIPDNVEDYPWGGHLGIKLIEKVIPVIEQSKTTLVFTNTRSQAEIWYQALLNAKPDWAGLIALHHGSLSKELREWVEHHLTTGFLKAVVCTSSLDLGVDYKPVDTVVQIGGPKGVARFLQRAGRSGHQPRAVSRIYFVPAHSLELIEGAALREAIALQQMEERIPLVRCFDVLSQFLVTLAVADGFLPHKTFDLIKKTHAFVSINADEWQQVLKFITQGSTSLQAYEQFAKVEQDADGYMRVKNKKIAYMHRLSIGAIVSEPSVTIKYLNGSYIGTVEEFFISKLKPGDVFTFGGKNLELISLYYTEVRVRKTNKPTKLIPSWAGGRMPLSSKMSHMIRHKISQAMQPTQEPELLSIQHLLSTQMQQSVVPAENEFLLEYWQSKEGYHLFGYTFEGRFVNEGIAALIAYRISAHTQPMTFSISMTDYGFELLSDQPIAIEEALENDIFNTHNLLNDMLAGLNASEMARRKFRDIAHIAGLLFSGFPGKPVKNKHLQAGAGNLFDVFRDYEPNHLLFKQAYEEVLFDQLEEARMRAALNRINQQKIILKHIQKPTPFCFPIMVERIREKSSTETLEDRVKKILKKYNVDTKS